MLRIFSKKKYLENGGEFPSFAEECNGRVVEGGVIRGTDYLLSAENEKRWCADYELKEGDKVVLNLPSWEENEAVTYMRKVGCIDDTICVRSNKFLPDFGKSDVAASLSRIERVCDFEAETAQKEPDEAEFSIALSIGDGWVTGALDVDTDEAFEIKTVLQNVGKQKIADVACSVVRELLSDFE